MFVVTCALVLVVARLRELPLQDSGAYSACLYPLTAIFVKGSGSADEFDTSLTLAIHLPLTIQQLSDCCMLLYIIIQSFEHTTEHIHATCCHNCITLTHSLIHSFFHSLFHVLNHSLKLAHLLNHSRMHARMHAKTHSLTHSFFLHYRLSPVHPYF